jgi:D-hexose-6-phosphate mutarotase
MYLHGGQVTSWTPAGADEVLFVSGHARWEPGGAIRGGVPVCFPWFGPHSSLADAPAHGAVRTRAWRLDAIDDRDGTITITMSTESDDGRGRSWPPYRLVHRATFGRTLSLALEVTNTGSAPLPFEAALHTYDRVGDIHSIRIEGLDGRRYLDALDSAREKTQHGDVVVTSEVDRVYLDTAGVIDLIDPTLRRRIRIAAERAAQTVVWNPWIAKSQRLSDLGDDEWRGFVCIETCNVSPRALALAPGGQHTMQVLISVEAYAP